MEARDPPGDTPAGGGDPGPSYSARSALPEPGGSACVREKDNMTQQCTLEGRRPPSLVRFDPQTGGGASPQ